MVILLDKKKKKRYILTDKNILLNLLVDFNDFLIKNWLKIKSKIFTFYFKKINKKNAPYNTGPA